MKFVRLVLIAESARTSIKMNSTQGQSELVEIYSKSEGRCDYGEQRTDLIKLDIDLIEAMVFHCEELTLSPHRSDNGTSKKAERKAKTKKPKNENKIK